MLNLLILQLLSAVETSVKNSPSKLDDITILPLIKMIRNLLESDSDLPGDIDKRREYAKKLISDYNLTDKVNQNEVEKILTSPGIWQSNLQHYLNQLANNNVSN